MKIRKISNLKKILYFGVVLLVVGCSSDNRPLYRNLPFEFAMHYNEGWEKKENYGTAIVVFLSPVEGKLDAFRENLTVSVDDVTSDISLNDYSDAVVKQIQMIDGLPDVYANIIESKNIVHRWKPGYQIVYTLTKYGFPEEYVERGLLPAVDKEGQTVQMMMKIFLRNQKAYIITFVAPQEKYDQYIEDAESMIKTLKIY